MVACGEHHTVILTQPGGTVYTCGINSQGQLGRGNPTPESAALPSVVDALSAIPIAHIASGAHHCFATSITGRAFSWGRNKYGQLGLGVEINEKTSIVRTPQPIVSLLGSWAEDENVASALCVENVACGGDHTAIVTRSGHLLSCGRNEHGQLGNRSRHNETNFQHIAIGDGSVFIKDVACGASHTLALSTNGVVYAWGKGDSGQLGILNDTQSKFSPVEVRFKSLDGRAKILGVFAGGDSSAAVMSRVQKQFLCASQVVSSARVGLSASLFLAEIDKCSQRFGGLTALVKYTFSSASILNSSFLKVPLGTDGAIDVAGAINAYDVLLGSSHRSAPTDGPVVKMGGILVDASIECCRSLRDHRFHSEDTVRVMIILFLLPPRIFRRLDVIYELCKIITWLDHAPREAFKRHLIEDVPPSVLAERFIRPLREIFDSYVDDYLKLAGTPRKNTRGSW